MYYPPIGRNETVLIEIGSRAVAWFYAGWHTTKHAYRIAGLK